MSAVKKHLNAIVFFVLLLLFIFLCVFLRKIIIINSMASALESVKVNIDSLFEDFLVPGGMKSSFTIKYESIGDEYLESVTLVNSKEDSYMHLGLKGLINLNAFSHKNKLGFYLPDNPKIRYTVSSKDFPSRWNSSVYGKIVKIPEFVPDNLSYKKINSFLNCKKIIEASVVFGLGKEKMNIKELTKNISVTNRDTYPIMLNGKKEIASIVRVSIPKEDIIRCILYNFCLADGKYKGYAVDYINSFKNYLESINVEKINIDLTLCKKKLIEAKLLLDTNDIRFNNRETGVSVYVKDINSQKLKYGINIDKPSPTKLTADIILNKSYTLIAEKNKQNMVYIKLEETKPKCQINKLTYHPQKTKPDVNYTEKDIYSLSLYELMNITQNIIKKSSL